MSIYGHMIANHERIDNRCGKKRGKKAAMAANERKIDTPINSSANSSPLIFGGSLGLGPRRRGARSGEFAAKVTLWQQFRALVSKHAILKRVLQFVYSASGALLMWTPWGPGEVSCIERCPQFRVN